jgi:hypothetical protein
MATTPRQILHAAYAKSKKNQPGQIAAEQTELLEVVIRATRGLFAFGARINPTYFGASSSVVSSGGGWPRPSGAEVIFKIEQTISKADVAVVPFDDRQAAGILDPAVYRYGQKYWIAVTNPLISLDLTFFYSKRPSDPANLDANLDALWTDQFNELLVLEVAIYLAIKDNRQEELAALAAQRDSWALLFAAHLEHETWGEIRRWGHQRLFNTEALVPTRLLLAGGTALQLGSIT